MNGLEVSGAFLLGGVWHFFLLLEFLFYYAGRNPIKTKDLIIIMEYYK
ncbi:MAG: hypothetical protein RHS_5909 [Robinsoniella sp. RHS]|nr:MAG: hypothetical protein RHS_5909 [Robinsoniella sp. RHS]